MKETLVSTRTLREGLAALDEQRRADAPYFEEGAALYAERIIRHVERLIGDAEKDEQDATRRALAARRIGEVQPTETPDALRDLSGLLRAPVGRISGVYFLTKGGALAYIGKSVNVLGRLLQHEGKDFDDAYVLPLPEPLLDPVECALIHHFKPPLNSLAGARAFGEDPGLIAELFGGQR
jgi:hypothetical protein